jgi:hypothetical protein
VTRLTLAAMTHPRTWRGALARATAGLLAALGLLALFATTLGAAAPSPAPRTVWHPAKGVTWQWQLDGRIDTSVAARVYDIDAQVSASVVRALHRRGRKVICYISAGSWENWRPDRARFPALVKGKPLDGWPGERWLDIRQLAVLRPIMAARMDGCRRKGFDGVEPDNVDGYTNDTGFPLTATQQRAYNLMLAGLAHARGLAVGLKNDTDQVRALQPHFDFAVNEQCVQYDECGVYRAFLRAGKPVLHAEYDLTTAQFCPTSRRLGLSSIRKRLALGAWRQTC